MRKIRNYISHIDMKQFPGLLICRNRSSTISYSIIPEITACLYPMMTILLLVSCGAEKLPLEDFYLPAMSENDRLVAVYQSHGSGSQMEYRLISRQGQLLDITFLDAFGRRDQQSTEVITNEGIVQSDLWFVRRDSSGKESIARPDIIENDLFPFDPNDSLHVYLHKIRWKENGYIKELIRNRRFYGYKTVETANTSALCATFRVDELYRDEEEGFLEIHIDGWEYYAKGKGLILKTMELGGGLTSSKALIELLPLEQAAKKYPRIFNRNTE